MRNKWRFAALVVLIVSLIGGSITLSARPVQAGGSWSAWLYNSDSGRLVHAFPDGVAPAEMLFPLPPGTSNYPASVTISRNGGLMAACLRSDAGEISLRVYDIYAEVYRSAYIFPGSIIDCSLSRYAFSEDDSQIVFGALTHYPDPADTRPDWQLMVMDISTSAILYSVTSAAPAITGLGLDTTGSLPVVSTFQMRTATFPGLISFKPVRWGTEPWPEYPGLVWQLDTGTVTRMDTYGKTSLDLLLPNSEAIWIEENDAFAKGSLEGPGYLFNVVMYSNKAGDLYPIFTNGSVLTSAAFIDDGRKIAVQYYPISGGSSQWAALDRSGTSTTLPADIQGWDLWGTMDGYTFMNPNSGPGGAPELRYHRFNASGGIDAFIAWQGGVNEFWRIVWVNPISGGLGLSPFPQVSSVGTPPTTGGTLYVGGQALVQTTAGDMLRVRSGPGTGFAVSLQVANGSVVNVLEGPIAGSEGYTWWRIESPGRGSGWAVEGVMDGSTYLQTLVPLP